MRQSCFGTEPGGGIFADEYHRKTGANAFGGRARDFVLELGEDLIANLCAVEHTCRHLALRFGLRAEE